MTHTPIRIRERRTAQIVRIAFAVWLFLYFYLLQAATLTLAQHQLSEGQTSYSVLVGAVLLTVLLSGLQTLVARFVRLREGWSALTCVPSAIIATLLTAFTPETSKAIVAVGICVFVVWCIAVWKVSRTEERSRWTEGHATDLKSAIVFLAVIMYMGLCSNSNDVVVYEVETAQALEDANYDEALAVGDQNLATSPRLTALRTYAMSHTEDGLAGSLFEYPIPAGGSSSLYVLPSDTLASTFPPDSLYAFLHCRPASDTVSARSYFHQAAKRRPSSPAHDYWLCALLLDKDLNTFAAELPQFYNVSDSVVLPRYYAEAMILYGRTCQKPTIVYTDPNVTANYLDFKEKEQKTQSEAARRNILWRDYGNTYWWYYFYSDKK